MAPTSSKKAARSGSVVETGRRATRTEARKKSTKTTTKTTKTTAAIRRRSEPATDRIERRRSGVHGWGVFATASIPKNKRIVDYAGEKVRTKASIPRQQRQLEKGHIWCFEINRAWVRDAEVGGNIARFINHSCVPNCYVQIVGDTIWVRAARTIRAGEELAYDYSTDGDKTIRCRCRPGCERML